MNNLENYMIPCPMKTITGIPCPGCGVQRAFIDFINGNFIDAIKAYPPLIPVVMMMVFMILHAKFNLKNGAFILKISFFINVIIIFLNYINNLILLFYG